MNMVKLCAFCFALSNYCIIRNPFQSRKICWSMTDYWIFTTDFWLGTSHQLRELDRVGMINPPQRLFLLVMEFTGTLYLEFFLLSVAFPLLNVHLLWDNLKTYRCVVRKLASVIVAFRTSMISWAHCLFDGPILPWPTLYYCYLKAIIPWNFLFLIELRSQLSCTSVVLRSVCCSSSYSKIFWRLFRRRDTLFRCRGQHPRESLMLLGGGGEKDFRNFNVTLCWCPGLWCA